ncbi:MAG: S-methyl-5-thioribose-1-phosphate isomerase [Thermodesulfobacteriota bacterium]
MKMDGKELRPIWLNADQATVNIIDQRLLPHDFVIAELKTVDHAITAIADMFVRGAPLIGVTGAYGIFLAAWNAPHGAPSDEYLLREAERIKAARPTAVNLSWAVERSLAEVLQAPPEHRMDAARKAAAEIAAEEADNCRRIGEHGYMLVEAIRRRKSDAPVNILTHCNAGWLACIEYGTATAPMYIAHEKGVDIHVWVDETRPLNQGARLTAWELGRRGIRHTVITDNAGGHLMQHGMVDLVIVGSDRTTYTGDVANKIGTYLKALAARDNGVPFYVALPSSTIDWTISDGIRDIPIENRNGDEIRYVQGLSQGRIQSVLVTPSESPAINHAFDVTPARLVTGLITERGVCKASMEGIQGLFPERRR